jgi:hypothetical protein
MPLTDIEFEVASALAAPLPPERRGDFLLAVENALRSWPQQAHGPGLTYRLCASLQSKFWDPPPRTISGPQHLTVKKLEHQRAAGVIFRSRDGAR